MRIDLEKAHVLDIPEYIRNLQANSNSENFADFYLEGIAALMFARAGCSVTIRERKEPPDLALRFNNEQFYAEVKHFRKKEQDRIDDAKMSEPGDYLVPYGDTAWEQVYDVAKHKIEKYKEHAPYVLVIESSSNCVEDCDVLTAKNKINEDVRSGKCPGLAKLNGILLITLGWYNISQKRQGYFCRTSNPAVSLSRELSGLLDGIRLG